MADLGLADATVRGWIRRFNAGGRAALRDERRTGRPATYPAAQIGVVVATALTPPLSLGLPFASWTLDRLAAYLNEERGIGEVLHAEGLRWRT